MGMSAEAHIALLKRFEPVIRYTRGEQFFPMDVERYVAACSLWVQRSGEEPICLIPKEELTLERLAQPHPDEPGAIHYLKLTDPLSAGELAAYSLQELLASRGSQEVFRAGRGRLARVGYISRFIDALFTITLLARGRVPGDTAAAANIAYKRILTEEEHYCYYGRVVRQNGWIVLQYWFFYLFNNWRSRFFGANDHEADWEMICVYLSESEAGDIRPEWVAYASHDYSGDDLRRRWDDPELEKVGEHPVVYAGAGSHASYYTAGEYLTELELLFLAPLARVSDRMQAFWHDTLRQYGEDEAQLEQSEASNMFRVPFVDYARGDGLSIGPGQEEEWDTPRLLSPPPPWVTAYRGLWGLYARDPFAGENAPAGPMYNRDSTVRRSWYDPVGWSGLDKVTPFHERLETVLKRQARVAARRATLKASVEEKGRELQELGVEAAAVREQPRLSAMYETYRERISELSQEIDQLRAQLASYQTLLESLERYADRLRAGERGPARAHIERPHQPTSDVELRMSRLAETWAAASIGLMLFGFVGLVLFAREYLVFGLMAIIALFVFIESSFRGRLIRLVSSVATGLAIVAALIIIYEFFWQIATLAVLITGGYILWENLRELWT